MSEAEQTHNQPVANLNQKILASMSELISTAKEQKALKDVANQEYKHAMKKLKILGESFPAELAASGVSFDKEEAEEGEGGEGEGGEAPAKKGKGGRKKASG